MNHNKKMHSSIVILAETILYRVIGFSRSDVVKGFDVTFFK